MQFFQGHRRWTRSSALLGGLVFALLALLLYEASPRRPGAGIPSASAQVTPSPSPMASPTPAATASPTPAATPTTAPAATPAATASPAPTTAPAVAPAVMPTASPTAAPTAAPTVAPTVAPTAAPAAPPSPATSPAAASQQASLALRVPQAAYVSGANPPTVGQTTRVAVTVEVRNTGNEALDLSDSVVCDLGPAVALGGAMLTRGAARLEGRTATWDGFGLMPGEQATLTMTLDITPPAGTAGQSLLVVSDVIATARTPAGALVEVRIAGLMTGGVAGIANRGLVVTSAAPAPAAPAPVAPAAAPPAAAQAPAPAAAAPRPATPSAVVMPRTGTGLTADTDASGTLPLVATLGLLVLTGGLVVVLRRRARAG